MALKLINEKDLAEKRLEDSAIHTDDAVLLGMASMYEDMLEIDNQNKIALTEIYEMIINGGSE